MGSSSRRCLALLLVSASLCAHVSAAASDTAVLAAERTRRKDPLDGLRYYTGGWNISNRHYLASAGFSAAPVFVLAALWFVAVAAAALVACCCRCCRGGAGGSNYSYSRRAFALSLVLLIVFTAAAVYEINGSINPVYSFNCSCSCSMFISDTEIVCWVQDRVRRAVPRAGQAPRKHDGDAGLRGEPGGLRGGDHARLRRPAGDGEGRGRRRGVAAARRRAGHRRRRAAGGRRLRRARRAHGQQLAQDPHRSGHHEEGADWCCGRDAGARVSWLRVLVDRVQVACEHSGVSWMDHNYCHANTVGHFPSPAQRDRRHLRGHGRVGGAAAGPHRARRHPPLRRRGGDNGSPSPERERQLPARLQAQRARLQRLQPRHPSPGRASTLLQPVRPTRAAPLQPLQRRPHRPPLRLRRGHRRRRATGVAALRLPDDDDGVVGGVRDGRAPDAGNAESDGHGGRRQRRDAAAGARAARPGELRHRAARVPGGRRARLPAAAAGQRPGVPGAARGVGGGHARRGGGGGALQGAAAAARERAVPGVAV